MPSCWTFPTSLREATLRALSFFKAQSRALVTSPRGPAARSLRVPRCPILAAGAGALPPPGTAGPPGARGRGGARGWRAERGRCGPAATAVRERIPCGPGRAGPGRAGQRCGRRGPAPRPLFSAGAGQSAAAPAREGRWRERACGARARRRRQDRSGAAGACPRRTERAREGGGERAVGSGRARSVSAGAAQRSRLARSRHRGSQGRLSGSRPARRPQVSAVGSARGGGSGSPAAALGPRPGPAAARGRPRRGRGAASGQGPGAA